MSVSPLIISAARPAAPPPKGNAILALGFRPLFLAAGVAGLLLIPLWLLRLGGMTLNGDFSPSAWHAHEMLFGYATAVISGFLWTAVRNWSGQDTPSGLPLLGLTLVWLAGRLVMLSPLPGEWIAGVDLAFLPLVALGIAGPIWRDRNRLNRLFIPLLLGMALANGLTHLEALGWPVVPGIGQRLMMGLVVVLLLWVLGRVLPFFTERAIPGLKTRMLGEIEKASVVLALLFLSLNLWYPTPAAGVAAITLAIVQGVRAWGWWDRRVLNIPILWVLHLGYGFLILGIAGVGLSHLGWVPGSLALHLLAVGGVGLLTLGMMARVSLGHTGRVLTTSRLTEFAFVLMAGATLFRVLGPGVFPQGYWLWLTLAGLLWSLAFALFLWVYAPILWQPRVDGQPG
ncbi:MAG: NnrS family protein [Pseudomonadota bacterium]